MFVGRLDDMIMCSMADSSQEQAIQGDMDHGLGDVDAMLIVAYQASPAGEPAVLLAAFYPRFATDL